jgi:hypothetical protein
MQRRTGLSMAQLSSELARISVALFLEHPLLYLRSVAEQWLGFWAVPRYWRPSLFRSTGIRRTVTQAWRVEHWFLRGVNLIFLVSCVPLLLRARRGRNAPPIARLFGTVALLVLSTSIVQALFEFGNTRYSIPTQALVGCTVFVFLWQIRTGIPARRSLGGPTTQGSL